MEEQTMKKILIPLIALALCISIAPVMAEEEPGDPKTFLSPDDNIWISISPMESHPMYIDRPAPTIPTIPGYPIRVAVYSNPYKYATIDENGNAVLVEINDPNAPEFNVSDLTPFLNGDITLRVNNRTNVEYPADSGAEYKTLHQENDYKWEFVFYVRNMDELDSTVDRFFFVAEDDVGIQYQGSGLVSVRETSQSGGGKDEQEPSNGGKKH